MRERICYLFARLTEIIGGLIMFILMCGMFTVWVFGLRYVFALLFLMLLDMWVCSIIERLLKVKD